MTTHAIVIGEELARSTDEAAVWRLYDFRNNRITVVDDVDKSYQVVPLSSLIEKLRATEQASGSVLHAEYSVTGAQQTILGATARQSIVRLGTYQRELWFASHPRIPANLFALMLASEPRSSSFAEVSRKVDEALLAARGFPFLEHAELPFGKEKLVVDRVVVNVEQRNVPAALLKIPRGYRNVTEPAASRPPASLPPPGRKTPEAGSPPSSTTRTTP